MAKIIRMRPTKRSIFRAAVQEMEKMYRLSHGGDDPIIEESSRELFESGQIDEVKWISWHRYCQTVLDGVEEPDTEQH